jgi:hypothetical protein
MKRLLLVFFFILSINAFAQDEKDQKYVGSFNAPTIDIKDYDRIDFALKKTLTEEELILSGKGLIVIIFSINGNGRILQIKSTLLQRVIS